MEKLWSDKRLTRRQDPITVSVAIKLFPKFFKIFFKIYASVFALVKAYFCFFAKFPVLIPIILIPDPTFVTSDIVIATLAFTKLGKTVCNPKKIKKPIKFTKKKTPIILKLIKKAQKVAASIYKAILIPLKAILIPLKLAAFAALDVKGLVVLG